VVELADACEQLLNGELERARPEACRVCPQLRSAYENACKTIAEMHSAAVGGTRGPIHGLVDDVANLRVQCDAMRAVVKAACDWSIHREADDDDVCLERLDIAAQAYIKKRDEQR
jgi:hypothetical protein